MTENRRFIWGIFLGVLLTALPVCAQTTAETDTKDVAVSTDTEKTTQTTKPVDEKKGDDAEPEKRENWLESLISKGTNELFKAQEEKERAAEKKRIEKVLLNRRSNAAHFDIAGVKLRMSPAEVEKILTEQGYRRIIQEELAPNFVKWRGEELCRVNGVVGFERLAACANRLARENGFMYIAHEMYNRYSTKESIEVFYTSTFTDNLAHHIYYKSSVPLSDSRASQNVYINNLKIYDFWRRIDLRYGKPDNTSEIKWGLGGRKPYLQASTGKLELADPLLKDLDVSRMLNEDSRLSNIPYYNF